MKYLSVHVARRSSMLNAHRVVEANANNWHRYSHLHDYVIIHPHHGFNDDLGGWSMALSGVFTISSLWSHFHLLLSMISSDTKKVHSSTKRFDYLVSLSQHFGFPNIGNRVCWTFDCILVSVPQLTFRLIAFACFAGHFSESISDRFQVSAMRWAPTTKRLSQFA